MVQARADVAMPLLRRYTSTILTGELAHVGMDEGLQSSVPVAKLAHRAVALHTQMTSAGGRLAPLGDSKYKQQ